MSSCSDHATGMHALRSNPGNRAEGGIPESVAAGAVRGRTVPLFGPLPRTLPEPLSAFAETAAALNRASAEIADPGRQLDGLRRALFARRSERNVVDPDRVGRNQFCAAGISLDPEPNRADRAVERQEDKPTFRFDR